LFTKLSDTSQAAIFSVLVLVMATGVALAIRFLELSPNLGMWILWSCTPTVAALIMLLVVTREGYSREGWKVLGLHRLGLNVWWIAFGLTLLITVAASAVVWATPLASFVVPEDGIVDSILNLLIQVVILTLTFSLAEEIGVRGYLLPKLLPLGRTRALALSGLVFATWHMPLIFLTPVFPIGNALISVPLFYGRGRQFRLRLPQALHGQRVASLPRAWGAQRRVGRAGSVHRNLLPRAGEQVSGGGLRATDPCWCSGRGHMAQPQTHEECS
jgi:membrane protease YdiL (CAAX protease family)